MNWYKLSSTARYKKAFPIKSRPQDREYGQLEYMDIGHQGKKNVLWFVDSNLRLHTIGEPGYHESWDEFQKAGSEKAGWGRCTRDRLIGGRKCSLVLNKGGSPQRIEYYRKKVTQILDREFDNPKISEF